MRFNPKIFTALRDYNSARLSRDVGAGLTVAVVALPLAMAFAMASGLKPESGIFTAIIAGFLISLFSGSRVQIGGPAGAFIVIVYGIVARYGVGGLLLATLMSGALLMLMGLFRMGVLIKFIPVAVIIGFTNGIAVLIGLSQIKEFLGLRIDGEVPAEFFALVHTLWAAAPSWNGWAVLLALGALGIIVGWQWHALGRTPSTAVPVRGWQRVRSLVPGSIVALVVATVCVQLFGLPVETIGSRFGGIPQGLPELTMPIPLGADGHLSAHALWMNVKLLAAPAVTLALLGAIESLLCARVADHMIHDKHDPNQELLSQGFANMVVPFFGGMPATGTIARTVTNVKNGANSPIAGMVHALALLVVVLVAAPLAQFIPLAALSAILMFVAWNMGEWREFLRLKKYRLPYRATLLAVFVLTIVVDLTAAVEVGILAACFTFIYRISSLSTQERCVLSQEWGQVGLRAPDVFAYRLSGAIFFGAVRCVETIQAHLPERFLVLDFSAVIYIDSSGTESLYELWQSCADADVRIVVCGLREQPEQILTRVGWLKKIGPQQVAADLAGARRIVSSF